MTKRNALTLPNWKFPYYNTDPCQNGNSSKLVKWVCVLSHFGHVQLIVTPWTAACWAPLSIGFSRQEYWNGLPCPPPGDLPNPRIKPVSLMSNLHWQAGSLPPPGKPSQTGKLMVEKNIWELFLPSNARNYRSKNWSFRGGLSTSPSQWSPDKQTHHLPQKHNKALEIRRCHWNCSNTLSFRIPLLPGVPKLE